MAFDGNLNEVRARHGTLWGNGYRPIAVYSPGALDRNHKPVKGAGKRPVGNDWRGRALRNPPADVRRAAKPGETNIGILCGEVVALDVDVLVQEIADEVVAKIEKALGWTPLSRIGLAPKIILCYRAEEPFPKLATKKYRLPDGSEAQLEILADGQQFVAFGEHPETMQAFEWPGQSPLDVPLAELPTISSMQARDLIGEADAILKAAGGVEIKPETKSGEGKKPEAKLNTRKGGSTEPGDFFRAVNGAALDDIALWAPLLGFHDRGNSGWRISSEELGRALEEDISIHANGIRDFGEEKGRSAIDVVIKLGGAADAVQAARWLCERLGKDPSALGWRDNLTPEAEPPPGWEERHPSPMDAPDGPAVGKGALPAGYKRAKGGIWYLAPAREDGTAPEPLRICADFQIEAETSDETHHAHGLLLRWTDRVGHPHVWAMPRKLVHSDGNLIAGELEDAGLHCETSRKAHEQLKHLLGAVRVNRRVRCVDRAGWHGKTYVLPDGRCYGADADTVVMQSEHIATGSLYAARGTLDEWRANIAGYAVRNDLLVFHISAAFAASLLDLTGEPSGGAHIDGASRVGKTTLLCSAASVWGPGKLGVQIRPWRATANGLEAVAAETSDGLLLLDEIGQANAREVGEVIYMLANQAGKSRANRAGGARRHKTWRVLYLSTGELTPAAKMAEAGLRLHAGQDVRLVTLSGDAGAGLGVFNDLHGMPSAAAMADHLRNAAGIYCGTAGPAFLEALTRDRAQDGEELLSIIRDLRDHFERKHLPDNANGQVRSVAGRFSLIAAAGELARRYGVVPWGEGDACWGVGACFGRWLAVRGGTGLAEDMQGVEAVRAFIAAHGNSRFENVDGDPDQRIINRAGFKRLSDDDRTWEYLIPPSIWRAEVCRGQDPKRAVARLLEMGLLIPGSSGGPTIVPRLGAHGTVRVYCIRGDILAE